LQRHPRHSLQRGHGSVAVMAHPHPTPTRSAGDLEWFQRHLPRRLRATLLSCHWVPPAASSLLFVLVLQSLIFRLCLLP
jgi:hypothetical protein